MKRLLILACALSASVQAAQLIVNGGFESGFSSWTRANQVGSDGTFSLQSGTVSPVNSFPVPAPPQGTLAAMTDALAGGSHVLYQDFVIPSIVPSAVASFSIFVRNDSTAFITPATLDWFTPTLNQQARVDIIRTSADPFSVASADVLMNLYRTQVGDPLISGYNNIVVDVTALLQANLGQTLRLRFAEVDNVANLNLGVDNVSLDTGGAVPEPTTWTLIASALVVAAVLRRR